MLSIMIINSIPSIIDNQHKQTVGITTLDAEFYSMLIVAFCAAMMIVVMSNVVLKSVLAPF
jgi:hypothetical protein